MQMMMNEIRKTEWNGNCIFKLKIGKSVPVCALLEAKTFMKLNWNGRAFVKYNDRILNVWQIQSDE